MCAPRAAGDAATVTHSIGRRVADPERMPRAACHFRKLTKFRHLLRNIAIGDDNS